MKGPWTDLFRQETYEMCRRLYRGDCGCATRRDGPCEVLQEMVGDAEGDIDRALKINEKVMEALGRECR